MQIILGKKSYISINFLIPEWHVTTTLKQVSNHAVHSLGITPLVLIFFYSLDKHDDKKVNGIDKYESEKMGTRYVFFPFIGLFFLS